MKSISRDKFDSASVEGQIRGRLVIRLERTKVALFHSHRQKDTL